MPALPESLTLRDGRVWLRDWAVRDAPALQPVCGDPLICDFTTVPAAFSPEDAEAWVRRQQRHRADGTALVLAVTRAGGGPALGAVNLSGLGAEDVRAAQLGYWLVPAARGGGLASAGARLACEWAFAELGLSRIEIAVLPANRASKRVAQRLGAAPAGQRLRRDRAGRSRTLQAFELRAPFGDRG